MPPAVASMNITGLGKLLNETENRWYYSLSHLKQILGYYV